MSNTNTTTNPTADLNAALARIQELEAKLASTKKPATNPCGCGCGELVVNRFKPGHDAKLKAKLIARYRNGGSDAKAAMKEATALGWERFLTAAPKTKKERRAEMKAELDNLRAEIAKLKASNE